MWVKSQQAFPHRVPEDAFDGRRRAGLSVGDHESASSSQWQTTTDTHLNHHRLSVGDHGDILFVHDRVLLKSDSAANSSNATREAGVEKGRRGGEPEGASSVPFNVESNEKKVWILRLESRLCSFNKESQTGSVAPMGGESMFVSIGLLY